MARGLRVAFPRERLAPPGQAHLAGERFARGDANARDLGVEGGERVKMRARARGREQGRKPSVARSLARNIRAMAVSQRERFGARFIFAHGAAMSSAATRRFSSIMTL